MRLDISRNDFDKYRTLDRSTIVLLVALLVYWFYHFQVGRDRASDVSGEYMKISQPTTKSGGSLGHLSLTRKMKFSF